LAEGWYDPATLEKARSSAASAPGPAGSHQDAIEEKHQATVPSAGDDEEEEANDNDDDDEYGPMPQYGLSSRGGGRAPGPAIPTMQDLELRKGTFSHNTPRLLSQLNDL
jgi:peroxin-14